MRRVRFDGGFEAWRVQARQLLGAGVAPAQVLWDDGSGGADLFAELAETTAEYARPARTASVPRELPEQLALAARYRSDDRWALLYRVLWRVAGGERQAMLAGDPDGSELQRRIKAVTREAHHLHAFLRFRRQPGPPEFVAWHATAHDVLDLGAEHFARRMGQHSWLIVTPEGAAFCADGEIRYQRPLDPALQAYAEGREDDCDALWQAYYASTFNPARLNEKVMRGHLPARFWKDLPEAALITGLARQARIGGQRLAQAPSVAAQPGRTVLIAREKAAPQRPPASQLGDCQACPLWQQATAAVPGEGPAKAALMLLGEQPGDHEDLAGRPFVGALGALLDAVLGELGLSRDALYLSYAVKHFKWQPRSGPQGRGAQRQALATTPAERQACSGWLHEELQRVQPRVLVALGRGAWQAVCDEPPPVDGGIRLAEGRQLLLAPSLAQVAQAPGSRAELREVLARAMAASVQA